MKYRRIFTHPEIGRLEGKLYDGPEGLDMLRGQNRDAARGELVYQQFVCADGREFYLNNAQLAVGLMWIEPAGEPAGQSSPVQFREEAVETAV